MSARRTATALAFLAALAAIAGAPVDARAATYSTEASDIRVASPQRGYVTATFTLSAEDAEFDCSQVSPGGCSVDLWARVQPAERSCEEHTGTMVYFLALNSNGTRSGTQSFRPAVEGDNRLCLTAQHHRKLVATAEATFTSADRYPSADDRNCSDFADQRAAVGVQPVASRRPVPPRRRQRRPGMPNAGLPVLLRV